MKWFRRGDRPSEAEQWESIQAEVRRAKEHRYALTVTQRDLVDEVSRLLFRADPVGINFETNTDEYDAEAETIVIALPNVHGPDDVKALEHTGRLSSGSTHGRLVLLSGTPKWHHRSGVFGSATRDRRDFGTSDLICRGQDGR